jgi:hypothetical protein
MSDKTITTEQQDFTASSLAQDAGVTFGYIAQLCRAGKIPARKFGNVWLIRYAVGAAWLEARKAKLAQP